jgi:hypothetical protein
MYLLRDGHASEQHGEVWPPGRIPGLHEFHPRAHDGLLHAKVALLGFSSSRTGVPQHLRLAVLTSNYTMASARHQLELAWVVDVPLDGAAPVLDRADIAAAADFIDTLLDRRFHRDEARLPAKQRVITRRLDQLLAAAREGAPASRRPRFIHSLERPLFEQIRERFRAGIDRPRNFLLCGSGFYEEASSSPGTMPEIFKRLGALDMLTASARRVALVDRTKENAVTAWARGGRLDGWELLRPQDPNDHGRLLHAKFIAVGFLRDEHLSNAWLYLGSGNLSRKGLLSHGGETRGNIETGVVFGVDERLAPEQIGERLFWVDNDDTIDPDVDDEPELAVDVDDPTADEVLAAPPILSAAISDGPPRRLRLRWRDDVEKDLRVDIAWNGRERFTVGDRDGIDLSDGEAPTSLQVWQGGGQWRVPIVDGSGRVGWTPSTFEVWEDALAALLDFPSDVRESPADDDDDDAAPERHGDGSPGADEGGEGADASALEAAERAARRRHDAQAEARRYALHTAAAFIEQVAAFQSALPPARLDDWIDHLDRLCRSPFPAVVVEAWRSHGLDPFAHLREVELRPAGLTDTQRARYVEVIGAASRRQGLS